MGLRVSLVWDFEGLGFIEFGDYSVEDLGLNVNRA